jgi:hypothetical protein
LMVVDKDSATPERASYPMKKLAYLARRLGS